MNLMWGVIPALVEDYTIEEQVEMAKVLVKEHGLAQEEDSILLVQGFNENEVLNHPSVTALKV
jgi:pyruvate kinase